MNNKYSVAALLLTVLILATSCIGDDTTEVKLYDDVAVTGFSLTTLERTMYMKTSSGADSMYTSNLSYASYKFHIDQKKNLIYNVDSLPARVKTNRCVSTITTMNGGYVFFKSLTSDSLNYYNATDSLDLSQPRTMKVVSNDGSWSKDYTIEVRVHKEVSDSVYWTNKFTNHTFATLEDMKSAALGNKIMVWGKQDGKAVMYASEVTDGNAWATVDMPMGNDMSAVSNGKTLYAYSAGKIYTTNDGNEWTLAGEQEGIKAMALATESDLYAITDDACIKVSHDGGKTWNTDAMINDGAFLPTRDICSAVTANQSNSDIRQLVIMGNRNVATDKGAQVWTKTIDIKNTGASQPWSLVEYSEDNYHRAPATSAMSVVNYGGELLMLSGYAINASKNEPLSGIYKSTDSGMNWWKDDRYNLPEKFESVASEFTMTADNANHLWIICGGSGQVWRCRLSDLTWNK